MYCFLFTFTSNCNNRKQSNTILSHITLTSDSHIYTQYTLFQVTVLACDETRMKTYFVFVGNQSES